MQTYSVQRFAKPAFLAPRVFDFFKLCYRWRVECKNMGLAEGTHIDSSTVSAVAAPAAANLHFLLDLLSTR